MESNEDSDFIHDDFRIGTVQNSSAATFTSTKRKQQTDERPMQSTSILIPSTPRLTSSRSRSLSLKQTVLPYAREKAKAKPYLLPSKSQHVKPLSVPRRKKSIIWYGVTKCRDDPKYNQCNYCDAKISNSNTTNSRHHLQIEHPKHQQWAEIVEKYGDIGDNAPITTSTESSDEEVVNKNKSGGVDGPLSDIPMSVSQEDTDTEAQAREKEVTKVQSSNCVEKERKQKKGMMQISLRKMMKKRKTAYSAKSTRRQILDEKLVALIYKDFQPFSIVDDIGFQEFVYELDPRYPIPSRGTLTNVLLPKTYQQARLKLGALLKELKSIAVHSMVGHQ